MSHIEEQRATLGTSIHDLEDRLKVEVQVDQWPGEPLEDERLIPSVPPAVGHPARKAKILTRLTLDLKTTNRSRGSPRKDPTSLILPKVDVEWRPFGVRRKTTLEFEP